jgi:dephospho-CoA kinase
MLRVGLTGGLGCGKTFVAAELERLGCKVVRADQLGHEVLSPGGPAFKPAIGLFGASILNPNGQIDRARLASIVFEDAAKLEALNAIVHPAVRLLEEALFSSIAAEDPAAIGVLEAAILIENGSYCTYDELIVVWCEPFLQVQRALERDPLADRTTVMARLARQMPVLEKRKYADFLIDTNGTKQDTLRQTRHVFIELKKLVTIEGNYEG